MYPRFGKDLPERVKLVGSAVCPGAEALTLLARGVDRTAAIRRAQAAFADPSCLADLRCMWRAQMALCCANATVSWDSHLITAGRHPELTALFRGRIEFFLGSPLTARAELASVSRTATVPELRRIGAAWLAELHAELGDLDQANAVLADWDFDRLIEQRPQCRPVLLAARGAVRIASGQAGGVEDYLTCGRELVSRGVTNPAALPWQGKAAVGALLAGRRELAEKLTEQDLAGSRKWGAPRTVGRALYVNALVRDDASSVDLLEESAHLLELALARTELAHVLLELGKRLAARGETVRAQTKLDRALDLASLAGNSHRAGQIAQVLHGVRQRPALSDHETRVATLARAGYTTKQIAAKLFLTPRGVEFHLSSTYRKLGISGRRELHTALADIPG